MKSLIEKFGILEPKAIQDDLFKEVVSTIVGQQLSTKAADTIWNRLVSIFPQGITPSAISDCPHETLRSVGLSNAKVKYVKGVAEAVLSRSIDMGKVATLDNDEVRKSLIPLKGIGPWSVEMILMFSLGREDIFSIGDLGLRSAISKLYGVDRENLPEIIKISKKWEPFRTYASRYLWMSLDNK